MVEAWSENKDPKLEDILLARLQANYAICWRKESEVDVAGCEE